MKILRSSAGLLEFPGAAYWPIWLALLGAIAVGVLVPRFGPLLAGAPVLGLLLLAAVWRWPLAGLVGTLTLTSTVFTYGALPRIGQAGASLYLPELLLIVLLLWCLTRTSGSESPAPSSRLAMIAFAGLVAASAISVLVSWAVRGESLTANLTQARWAPLYALYFVTRQVLADRSNFRRLICALLAIGAVTAVIFDLTVLTSLRDIMGAYPLFAVDSHDLYVSASSDAIEGARIYMPGRALVQVLFFPALVGMLVSPPGVFRRVTTVLTLLFGITLVLIFTRMVWVTSLVAIVVLAVLISRQQRATLLKVSAWLGAAVVIATLAFSVVTESSGTSALQTISLRFGTVFSDNVQDQDAQYRLDEASATLAKAQESWWLGSGFLATVRAVPTYDPVTGEPIFQEIGTGHNGYLSLLLNTGLVGLGFFLLLCAAVVRACWLARTRLPGQDWFTWAMTLGFAVALLRILLNGVSESTFSDSFTVPLMGVAFALVERGIASDSDPGRADAAN